MYSIIYLYHCVCTKCAQCTIYILTHYIYKYITYTPTPFAKRTWLRTNQNASYPAANTQITAAVVARTQSKEHICFVYFGIRISIHLKQYYIFNTKSNTIRIYCFLPSNICHCNDSVIRTIGFLYFINP